MKNWVFNTILSFDLIIYPKIGLWTVCRICKRKYWVLGNVGSHSNATQKHSTRAQKMECYGSNPFALKMDWSRATTFQLYIALCIAHELAFRKWEAEKREQSNPHSRMCICFDWTWIGEWRFHSECDPTLVFLYHLPLYHTSNNPGSEDPKKGGSKRLSSFWNFLACSFWGFSPWSPLVKLSWHKKHSHFGTLSWTSFPSKAFWL